MSADDALARAVAIVSEAFPGSRVILDGSAATNLERALALRKRGFAPIPLEPQGKKPRVPWEKYQLQRPTEAELIAWWTEQPDANIGIITGRVSGNLIVVDVDYQHRPANAPPLPFPTNTVTVRTGNGAHYYFRANGCEIRNSAGRLGPGLDVRGEGGYVVAPPSIHASGKPYVWEPGWGLDDIEIAALPVEIAGRLDERRKVEPLPESIVEGERNDRLTSVAGSLRARGAAEAEIRGALGVINQSRCKPPLKDDELRTIAASVSRYEPAASGTVAPPEIERASLESEHTVEYLDLEGIAEHGVPPIEWHLPGWIAFKDIANFAGAGGIGKTTTVGALALSVASGRPWCDLPVAEPQRVLVFDEEQDEETTARLYLRLGAPHPNLKVASGQGIRLDTPEGVARLEAEIASHRPGLVVLDSVQQTFGAAKENDATEIGAVYRELFRLRDLYGVAFLLVHHRRKAQPGVRAEALDLVRGSTAHGTQASAVWFAYPGDRGRLNIIQAKRRGAPKQSLQIAYTEDGDRIVLSGEGPVEDGDTAIERASEWIVSYLADHDLARAAQLKEAGEGEGFGTSLVERTLRHLLKVGSIQRPSRGLYRATEAKATEA